MFVSEGTRAARLNLAGSGAPCGLPGADVDGSRFDIRASGT